MQYKFYILTIKIPNYIYNNELLSKENIYTIIIHIGNKYYTKFVYIFETEKNNRK